jgi:hypothetical protein
MSQCPIWYYFFTKEKMPSGIGISPEKDRGSIITLSFCFSAM